MAKNKFNKGDIVFVVPNKEYEGSMNESFSLDRDITVGVGSIFKWQRQTFEVVDNRFPLIVMESKKFGEV